MSSVPFWIGILCLVFLTGFVVFGFRQGFQVRNPPEGVPPEVTPPGAGHGGA